MPTTKAQTPCKYHLLSTCHRGRTCSYLHSPAPTTTGTGTSIPSTSILRPTAAPFIPPCRFAAAGYCSRPRCPFTHPPAPPASPPPPAPTTLTATLANHTVTFGPGLAIQSTTPVLPPTLHIHNLPADITPGTLAALLAPYEPHETTLTATHAAVHLPYKHLPAAISALHASRVDGTLITATPAPAPGAASTRADTLLVTYPAPSCTAILALPPDAAAAAAPRQEGTMLGRRIRVTNAGHGMFRVTGVPPSARACDVTRCLQLPEADVVELGEASYEEEEEGESTAYVRSLLESDGRTVLSCEVVSAAGEGAVKMVVRMGSAEMARGAAKEVGGRVCEFLGGAKVRVRLVYSARLRSSKRIWRVVGGEVEALQRALRGKLVRVGVFKDGGGGGGSGGEGGEGGHVSVTIGGCDRAAVCDAKRRVAGIIAGEVVALPGGIPLWNDTLVTTAGIRVLRSIQAGTGAYIHYDVQKRRLAAYGTPTARTAARARLLAHIGTLPPPPPPPEEAAAGEGECPVCLTAPTDAVVVPTCGHAYCGDCLSAFLDSTHSTRSFPISCISCRAPLPLSLIPGTLHAAAWSDYVLTHATQLRFCSTADCSGVLPVTAEGEEALCGECLVEQCTRCGVASHDGMSCADWKVASDTEAERLFGEWAAGKDVKSCAGQGCGAVIEKIDGCNHVQCQRCLAHMCWVCGKLFSSREVYVHMREVHGGIGLEEAVGGFEPPQWGAGGMAGADGW
ncbi:uncharacterized protein H6S33_003769 [Morchella sextelata]|uniref:uncharacterized protein n=1 Tax=Morchella sextelata TaxID=1174677 RepID=UPI001D045C8D|nr:uncharacterized protein H6S33_003769 [Morchella sextelata]KAH0606108.1 hypothetical protein H6S33_003769 [Morchella sextelata]